MKSFNYFLRFVAWFIVGLIALLLLVAALVQLPAAQQKLLGYAEKQAANALKGDIKIHAISGNLFTSLQLENILWTYRDDTIASIKSIDFTYNLLPLINKKISILSGRIDEPYLFLRQEKDSTWNIQNMLIEQENEKEADSASTSQDFSLSFSDFELLRGNLLVQAYDTLIPREIKNLDCKLDFSYSATKQSLDLARFSFQTKQPDFYLQNLSFILERDTESINVDHLAIKTARNNLQGQAAYQNAPDVHASAKLESSQIQVSEFEYFVPSLKIPAHPNLNIKVQSENESLKASINVSDKKQNIQLDITSDNFTQFVADQENTRLSYNIDGKLENIDLAHWLGDTALHYLINGHFALTGSGTDPKTANLQLDVNFNDCIIEEQPVKTLLAEMTFNKGNLEGKLNGNGNFGTFSLCHQIKNLQQAPAYEVWMSTNQLNLAPLLGTDTLQTGINLQAHIRGSGFDLETMFAQAEISLTESHLAGVVLDTVVGNIRFQSKTTYIDSFWVKTQQARLAASGNYKLDGKIDMALLAHFDALDEFAHYLPLDTLMAKGNVNAQLSGSTETMDITALTELKEVQVNDITAGSLIINGTGKLVSGDTVFQVSATAENFRAGNFALDSILTNIDYYLDSASVWVKGSGKDFSSTLAAQIALDSGVVVTLSQWDINQKNQYLALQHPPALFNINPSLYHVANFKMASGPSDSAQYVIANGTISRSGNQDFSLEVANLGIKKILDNIGMELETPAKLNVGIKLKGTGAHPEISGNFAVDEPLFNKYAFTDFSGKFTLKDDRLKVLGKVIPRDSGNVKLNGSFPVKLRLDSFSVNFNPKDSIHATLAVEHFSLTVLQALNLQEQVQGILDGKIILQGTPEEPDPSGNLKLAAGLAMIPEYGIEYRDIVFDLNFTNHTVRLDSFSIKSNDGDVKAHGSVDFNSAIYNGDVSQSEIEIHFNKFNPVDHRQFNMQLSGGANMKGKKGDVVFEGDLNIPQAQIYLPAILSMTGQLSAPKIPQPILIREMNKQSAPKAVPETKTADSTITSRSGISYLNDYTGKLNIETPKNVWIKNEDMYIEIAGNLELRKNTGGFELFGSLAVVRGQYDLLGKTFIIDEGNISFQGGEEIIPRLHMAATYTFRNSERAEQDIGVVIEGTPDKPNVEFELDGSTIDEGDALSYILFGKSMNELTMDQQQNVIGAGDLATTAASALLSSQLTNLLGNNLNVDYIEVKSDGDFNNTTLVVGKYITNDLFVSYEQRFGETDEKDMAKYEVKLEYELFKFFFLQLNNSSNDSGFDLIFKLNSKKN